MTKPVPVTARQMHARTCALSAVNHLRKANTQLATITALGERTGADVYAAEVAAELRRCLDMVESVDVLSGMKP